MGEQHSLRMEKVYDTVVYEFFTYNFGDDDIASDEESKGTSELLRGLESHQEFSINPVFFATCAPLFINASVVIIYRYYREIMMALQKQGCISCGILVSGIRARGVSWEHMENMEMFSCSP